MMHYDPELVRAWNRRVRKRQRPDAERDPDGRGWILRYSRAFLLNAWSHAFILALLFSLFVVFVVVAPPEISRVEAVLLCSFLAALQPLLVYHVMASHRLTVRFDEEGFTVERFLFKSERLAWADVRSVRLSSTEDHLVIDKERGYVNVPVHVHGLGRFGLYLEQFAPVAFPPDVRAVIPQLETSPDQTLASDVR